MKRRAEVESSSAKITVAKVRLQVARILWLVCALAALFLAVGALLIALDANQSNDLVKFVLDVADKLDLEVFSRQDGIKEFTGKNADTKNALFNWGLAAIAWLVVGKILDRVVRP